VGCLDLCHIDEAGFAPTLPTCYSWSLVGERLVVPYEAPQGRRVNVIGAYFSHGPAAGEFRFDSYARLPKNRAKRPRKSLAERAVEHGLSPEDVAVIDSERFLAFVWKVAGRPEGTAEGWKRERPLVVVLDNYGVHTSERVRKGGPALAAADIGFFYLPAYSPELSDIEPIWNTTKHHDLPDRSHALLGALKRAVDTALTHKADRLRAARQNHAPSLRPTA
jgi:transposase